MTTAPTKLDVLEALLETSKLATDLYDTIESGERLEAEYQTIAKLAGLIRTLDAAHQSLVADYILSGRASNEILERLGAPLRDNYRPPHA